MLYQKIASRIYVSTRITLKYASLQIASETTF